LIFFEIEYLGLNFNSFLILELLYLVCEVIINKKCDIKKFEEKPQVKQGWINGGFFVFNSKIFKYIKGDLTMLEREPIKKLLNKNQIKAFKHESFWKCMDTLRDKIQLDEMIKNKNTPWI